MLPSIHVVVHIRQPLEQAGPRPHDIRVGHALDVLLKVAGAVDAWQVAGVECEVNLEHAELVLVQFGGQREDLRLEGCPLGGSPHVIREPRQFVEVVQLLHKGVVRPGLGVARRGWLAQGRHRTQDVGHGAFVRGTDLPSVSQARGTTVGTPGTWQLESGFHGERSLAA